jgi:hypothetical protein
MIGYSVIQRTNPMSLFVRFFFHLMKKFASIMRQPTRSTSQRQTAFRRLRKMWKVGALVTMRWWLNGRWKHLYNKLWRRRRNPSGSRFLSVKELCVIWIEKRKFQVVACCLVRCRNKLANWVFGFQKHAVKTDLKRHFPYTSIYV